MRRLSCGLTWMSWMRYSVPSGFLMTAYISTVLRRLPDFVRPIGFFCGGGAQEVGRSVLAGEGVGLRCRRHRACRKFVCAHAAGWSSGGGGREGRETRAAALLVLIAAPSALRVHAGAAGAPGSGRRARWKPSLSISASSGARGDTGELSHVVILHQCEPSPAARYHAQRAASRAMRLSASPAQARDHRRAWAPCTVNEGDTAPRRAVPVAIRPGGDRSTR